MKKALSILLSVLMTATLVSCGSDSKDTEETVPSDSETAAETETNTNPSDSETSEQTETDPEMIPGTKLAMPDKETGLPSKSAEILEDPDDHEYDLQINVYYESPEKASEAYTEYYYRMLEIHSKKDSDGNRIVFTQDPEAFAAKGADNYTFYVKYAPEEAEEATDSVPIQQYAGRYLVVEMVGDGQDYTDFLKSAWEDKTFYEYIEICENGDFIFYIYQEGEATEASRSLVTSATSDSITLTTGEVLKIENGKFTVESDGNTLVFEKNDEIPEN